MGSREDSSTVTSFKPPVNVLMNVKSMFAPRVHRAPSLFKSGALKRNESELSLVLYLLTVGYSLRLWCFWSLLFAGCIHARGRTRYYKQLVRYALQLTLVIPQLMEIAEKDGILLPEAPNLTEKTLFLDTNMRFVLGYMVFSMASVLC